MKWTIAFDGGPQRVNHAAIGVPERKLMFSFGGYWAAKEYNDIEKIDTNVFNFALFKWFKLKTPNCSDPEYLEIPFMRYGHTVCAVEGIAYLFGGRNDKYGASDVLHCFDTEKLKWYIPDTFGAPPSARDGHSSCTLGANVYIFGGYEERRDCFSNEIHFLDTKIMTWQHLNPKGVRPPWRDFHTSTTVANKIYVFGGRSDDSDDAAGQFHTNREVYDNQIYEYDTGNNVWTCVPVSGVVPTGRRSHSAVTLGSSVFVFGGYNGKLNKHFNDLWKFDTVNKQWHELHIHGNGPCPRRRQSWCLLGTEAVLYGGTCPVPDGSGTIVFDDITNLKDLSDVYIFDFAPTLKKLCQLFVVKHKLDSDILPARLRLELERMTVTTLSHRSLVGLSQG